MAPLCADNNNLMAYHLPLAPSARSEASLMAIAQQLVQHQQQHKHFQHAQSQQQQQQQQAGTSVAKEPTSSPGSMNQWAVSTPAWHSKPEEFAVPSTSFYSDVAYDFNPSSGSFFTESASVLDLSGTTLLMPSVDSQIQDSEFLFRDPCFVKPDLIGSEGVDFHKASDSYPSERYDGNRGCKFLGPDELSDSLTRPDEMGELVGFLPSSCLKLTNLQSIAIDSAQATGSRADFGFADVSSEWMDCLMSDLQPEDADETIVSCFDTNPCESTQSSEPAMATNGFPCTSEDALPDGFTVLKEAQRCMQSRSEDVSPSWTQDTGNEVLSSSPSRELLSASSPDLISTNSLNRARIQEPQYVGPASQATHGLQAYPSACARQGSADTPAWTTFRPDGHVAAQVSSVGEDDAIRRAEFGHPVPAHGVQLMQLLLECARTVDSDHERASKVLPELRALSKRNGDPIQRLAAYFTEALSRRLARAQGVSERVCLRREELTAAEVTEAYKALNDACPYFTFAQLTANQAILEAIEEAERVHIVDFGISAGVQWAALLQAIASRARAPARIRITGVASPELGSDARAESLAATGRRLAEFGRQLQLTVEFRAVDAGLAEDALAAEMIGVEPGEVVAVNFMLELCNLLSGDASEVAVARVLRVAAQLSPRVATLAEMDARLNAGPFEQRFVGALHFFSAMFDSLEASMRRDCPQRLRMERWLLGERIASIVGGADDDGRRRRRLQAHAQWRAAMQAAGFRPAPLSPYAVSQARILLWRFCDSFTLGEEEGSLSLSLGWQNKPLLTVSTWTSPHPAPSSSSSPVP